MIVAGDEAERRRGVGARDVRLDQRRRDALDEQRRGGGVAIVHLVAHVERLRHQRFQLDRAGPRQHGAQRRGDDVGDHPQAVNHRRVVGAEAQHLAEPFVEVAVGAIARGPVLDDEDRHRRADDPGHRSDGAMVMAGFEIEAARRDQALGGRHRIGPSFEHHRAQHRAAHRPAHR